MTLIARLRRAGAVFGLVGTVALVPAGLGAQEHPVRRVANIVSVAVDEYGRGVDQNGRVFSVMEYQEAVDFLADARNAAVRLSGDRAPAARAILDSIIAAVAAKRPPAVIIDLERRFGAALGSDAALELPKSPLNVAAGDSLYRANCASCHGRTGLGDGVEAAKFDPRPPAIGSAEAMYAVTPGMMFRKISVGVSGTGMPAFAATLTAEDRWNIVVYLGSLRARPEQVAEGEGVYAQTCVSCHGSLGTGDGLLARSLSKLPPEVGSLVWHAQRSDSQIAHVVRQGIPGSPMPPASQLTATQVKSVVAYLRTLPLKARVLTAAQGNDSVSLDATATSRKVLSIINRALTAAQADRVDDASDLAFDAYVAFEPIESPAKARSPGVVASMEKLFADFRGAVRQKDLRGAKRAADAIEAGMPRILELTRPTGSGKEAFFQSLLIILREGLEAILVVGAVVALLLKTGHRERLRLIWIGVGAALVASAVTAVVLKTILSAIPASREIIEGVTLLIAVGVLFSVSYWLISRVEAAKWQQFIREKVTTALNQGGGKALAFVAFLAVYREGAETALFYQALLNEGTHVVLPISLGILVGLAILAVIFTLFYRFGVRIPLRKFFAVTSVLLYYMAFVFLGKGIAELQEGNAIPINVIPGMPRIDSLGLFPTWQAVSAQLVLLALFVFALAKTFWPKRSVTLPTVAPTSTPVSDVAGELQELRTELARLRAHVAQLEERKEALGARSEN